MKWQYEHYDNLLHFFFLHCILMKNYGLSFFENEILSLNGIMKMDNRPVTLILLALTVFRIFICELQYVKYLTFFKKNLYLI